MLLRESGREDNKQYALNAVTASTGDSGVPHSNLLRQLTEATISGDWLALAAMRDDAESEMGRQQVVDALSVAAAFNGITRVADCTGIPLDPDTQQNTQELRQTTGIADFEYARKTARYEPARG